MRENTGGCSPSPPSPTEERAGERRHSLKIPSSWPSPRAPPAGRGNSWLRERTNFSTKHIEHSIRMTHRIDSSEVERWALNVECFFTMNSAASPVPVIRRARAFAGNHRRTQGMLRRAFRAERGTFLRLLQSLQYQAADAFLRFLDMMFRHAEFFLGVEGRIRFVQAQAALRDFTDAAPFARDDAEHLTDQFLRRLVAFAAHRARILVFDFGPARFQLFHHHQHAL